MENLDLAKKFEDFKTQQTEQDIKGIYKELVVDVEVKKIPEATFLQEILPALTKATTSSDFPKLVAAVAGSPFSEIDVIDHAGNILFRMPSLLERNAYDVTEVNDQPNSLGSIVATMELLKNQSPKKAANFFNHVMLGRGVSNERINKLTEERRVRWVDILARYGYIVDNAGEVIKNDGSVKALPGKDSKAHTGTKPVLSYDDSELL